MSVINLISSYLKIFDRKLYKTFKNRTVGRLVISILFISFVLLMYFSMNYPYFPLDYYLTLSIQAIDNIWFHWLMLFLTTLGYEEWVVITLVIASVTLSLLKKYKDSAFLIISTLGISVISYLLKIFVGRPRPDAAIIDYLDRVYQDNSFPSGHVLFYIGFYGFILYLVYRYLQDSLLKLLLIILLILMIVLIGISRIYLGAHWFSDTLGSYLLGSLWLLLIVYIYHRIRK